MGEARMAANLVNPTTQDLLAITIRIDLALPEAGQESSTGSAEAERHTKIIAVKLAWPRLPKTAAADVQDPHRMNRSNSVSTTATAWASRNLRSYCSRHAGLMFASGGFAIVPTNPSRG